VGWPTELTLQVRPVSETTIALVACNPTGSAATATGTVRVLGIDQ
jgi:hypothetical protein